MADLSSFEDRTSSQVYREGVPSSNVGGHYIPLTPVPRAPTMREIGAKGGQAVFAKYGRLHMGAIGQLGGLARRIGRSKEEMHEWAKRGGNAPHKTRGRQEEAKRREEDRDEVEEFLKRQPYPKDH